MEISQEELLAMLATERARAQQEADDRHARELTRLREDLDRSRQSSGWVAPAESPGLASQVQMFLDLQSPGTRRTYASYLQGVLLSVPPCHGRAQLTDSGELVVPSVDRAQQLCATLGCDPDTDTHATLGALTGPPPCSRTPRMRGCPHGTRREQTHETEVLRGVQGERGCAGPGDGPVDRRGR